jgi:hypothetical protein
VGKVTQTEALVADLVRVMNAANAEGEKAYIRWPG